MATDWQRVRADFPILDQMVHGHPLIYLDNAASSQKPRSVIDALRRYYERDNANVHRGIHELSNRATAGFEGARERVARFLNAASAEEIVFTRGTTEGINLVAQAWGNTHLRRGETVILTEMEHHSNLVPWQMLAQRTGARLRFLPVTGPEGQLDLEPLDRWLAEGARLLSLVHISNSLGTINPVVEICARARRAGVVTLVDAAQSAGHAPVDVRAMGCDFLAFSGHKICGPTGIGVLYGRRDMLAALPPYQGGGEMILDVEFDRSTYKPAPHRFEAGTPHIAGPIGLHAAMDYLDAIGRAAILEHDQALARHAVQQLEARVPGIQIYGPRETRGGLVSFRLREAHAHDVVTIADLRGVALRGGHHCTQPLMKKLGIDSTARASFYLYNTREEVDRMVEVIVEIQKFFAP